MSMLVVAVVIGVLREFHVAEFATIVSRALAGDGRAILGLLLAAAFVFVVLLLSADPRRRNSWGDEDQDPKGP